MTSFDNEPVYIQTYEIHLGQSLQDDLIRQYIDGNCPTLVDNSDESNSAIKF